MGRPWEYPRWRRVLMQVVMWVVFAGSLGLAQLISVHNRNAVEAMEASVQVDGFQVRLPEDWTVQRLPVPIADGTEGQAIQASDGHRVLQVVVLPVQLLGQVDGPGIGAASTSARRIEFSGLHVTGTMRVESRVRRIPQGGSMLERTVTATASVPPHNVILVQLVVPGAEQVSSTDLRADVRLVHEVAAGITASPTPDQTDEDDGT